MGSCTSAKYREEQEEIARKFDSFDFRINENDELTFIERAKQELIGTYAPDEFIARLFKGYREFMIEVATQILVSKKNPEQGKFICILTPAPLIDEIWCLSILYTKKYKELCEYLVGGVIERVPSADLKGLKMFKKLWPDYSKDFWGVDRKYVVWIYNKDIGEILNLQYDKIISLQKKDKISFLKKDLEVNIKILSDIISERYSKLDLTPADGIIPDDHPNYNPEVVWSLDFVYRKVSSLLPKILSSQHKIKYSVGNKSEYYIKEYARFMTMLYFSKFTLTPSEEVNQVWHLHQSYPIEYRTFCMSIYGKVIEHTPTVGGEAESLKYSNLYVETVEFYKFLFKEAPPIGLWPSTHSRFDSQDFVGGWYSLARILICITRVIEIYLKTRPPDVPIEILNCYFAWAGMNLFKKSKYTVNLVKDTKIKSGSASKYYWHAGECAIASEANENRGANYKKVRGVEENRETGGGGECDE